jgi:hypothetical protein
MSRKWVKAPDHLSAEVPLSARSPVDAIDEREGSAPTSSPRETAPDPVGQYGRLTPSRGRGVGRDRGVSGSRRGIVTGQMLSPHQEAIGFVYPTGSPWVGHDVASTATHRTDPGMANRLEAERSPSSFAPSGGAERLQDPDLLQELPRTRRRQAGCTSWDPPPRPLLFADRDQAVKSRRRSPPRRTWRPSALAANCRGSETPVMRSTCGFAAGGEDEPATLKTSQRL